MIPTEREGFSGQCLFLTSAWQMLLTDALGSETAQAWMNVHISLHGLIEFNDETCKKNI